MHKNLARNFFISNQFDFFFCRGGGWSSVCLNLDDIDLLKLLPIGFLTLSLLLLVVDLLLNRLQLHSWTALEPSQGKVVNRIQKVFPSKLQADTQQTTCIQHRTEKWQHVTEFLPHTHWQCRTYFFSSPSCQLLHVLTTYCTLSTYSWMLCEGLYLQVGSLISSEITVFFFWGTYAKCIFTNISSFSCCPAFSLIRRESFCFVFLAGALHFSLSSFTTPFQSIR